jgi:hypothetical protein
MGNAIAHMAVKQSQWKSCDSRVRSGAMQRTAPRNCRETRTLTSFIKAIQNFIFLFSGTVDRGILGFPLFETSNYR